jgi:uncharacterized alkaline shock family protein YloU
MQNRQVSKPILALGVIMPTKEEELGTIDISTATIATIANQAINQCYGVVGMASKNLVNDIAHFLARDGARRCIEIAIENEEIVIDVYVIVEYGVRIRTVAESIQNTVKYHVEKALGLPVREVNIYVQGLRINRDK